MKRTRWTVLVLALAVLLPSLAEARIEVPRVFGDGMVVQRDKPVNVWGWGERGDAITAEFNGQTRTTTVGDDGKWLLTLDPMPVNAKPQELKIRGKKDSLEFKNVVIGDVWLCSGQSNMEAAAYDYEAELARKSAGWKRQVEKAETAGRKPPPIPDVPKTYTYRQSFPGGCFNALIAPIQRFAIKGVIFYQGENNCVGGQGRPNLYMKTFPALIPDWRKAFHDPALPFCIVQMTSFGFPDDENEPEQAMLHKASGVREAQTKAHLKHGNTGLVCTYDLGHIQMHSPFKRPIGERAARWALADVYRIEGIEYNIPLLESWEKDGKRILLTFTKGSHPSSRYGVRVAPRGFVIADKARHFYPAQVEAVEGGKFAVSSPFVEDPAAVRYAWGVHPVADFGNRAGPAAPFRTDDWPCWIDSGYRRGEPSVDPNADQVPTPEAAKRQAWERKAAQSRKVLEQYETWKKGQKP